MRGRKANSLENATTMLGKRGVGRWVGGGKGNVSIIITLAPPKFSDMEVLAYNAVGFCKQHWKNRVLLASKFGQNVERRRGGRGSLPIPNF